MWCWRTSFSIRTSVWKSIPRLRPIICSRNWNSWPGWIIVWPPGAPEPASLERARAEFLERHLAHWIRPLANLARNADGDCYADLLDALSLEIESALE